MRLILHFRIAEMHTRLFSKHTVIYSVSGLSWFPWSTHLDPWKTSEFWTAPFVLSEIPYSATMPSIRAPSSCLVGWHKRYPEMRHPEGHVRKRWKLSCQIHQLCGNSSFNWLFSYPCQVKKKTHQHTSRACGLCQIYDVQIAPKHLDLPTRHV